MAIRDNLKGRLGSVRDTAGGITDAAAGAVSGVASAVGDVSNITGQVGDIANSLTIITQLHNSAKKNAFDSSRSSNCNRARHFDRSNNSPDRSAVSMPITTVFFSLVTPGDPG